MLYANGYGGILVSFVAASILVYAFLDAHHTAFKQIWWMVMSGLLLIRLVDTIWWHKSPIHSAKISIIRFTLGTQLTGIIWCVYCLVIMGQADNIELASTIIIVAALAGGGATVLSGHMFTSIFYAFILLGPYSMALLLSEAEHRQYLGVLGLSFCLVMIVGARKAALFTQEAIKLKNENALLVNHMEEQVERRTQKIYELSNLDPLSKLLNRTAFSKQLQGALAQSIAEKSNLALLFIDLDGFKKINDTIGHETGDQLLIQTASRLKALCEEQHVLCRWGGDEFLLALPKSSEKQAAERANQIIQKISEPYTFSDNSLSIGATIGIAMFPEHGQQADQLIQLADMAMYNQKKQSPSTAGLFSAHLSTQLYREQHLKDGLAQAIENNEFSVNFQPIVEAKNKSVAAFEALLRWQHKGEHIGPDEFIPIAEQYGSIRKIGEWVLQQACLECAKWPSELAISVCVNVSVVQLQEDEFIHVVDNAIRQSKLPPEKLHIEITESIFASDKSILLRRIKSLQGRGIKVSIDDFGTEYSSLSVLQDTNANMIKIDKSFVSSIHENGYPIVQAVMQIASALDYVVVAEGVETLSQADMLQNVGVHYLQGYFFAKPMPADEVCPYLSLRDGKKLQIPHS